MTLFIRFTFYKGEENKKFDPIIPYVRKQTMNKVTSEIGRILVVANLIIYDAVCRYHYHLRTS